jgi:hypothetical protein
MTRLFRLIAAFCAKKLFRSDQVPADNIIKTQMKRSIVSVKGTATFVWHDGQQLYDEVAWDPRPVTRDTAYEIALRRMQSDRRATRVHVDFGESTFVEVTRPTVLAAGSLRVISEGQAA